MRHTPGPWINDASHPEWERNVIWANDVVVAHVVDDQHGNADANASLIAAAPDLLALCKTLRQRLAALVRHIDEDTDSDADLAHDRDAVDDADAAIAKAEGRE